MIHIGTVGAYSVTHVMEKYLIQIWRHVREYYIIIILANAIPYIYKAVSTLPIPGAYSLLNLDKGQFCGVGEILDC